MASRARERFVNICGMCRRARRTVVVPQGRRRLEVDDAVHAARLSGLKHQLKHAGDEGGTHVTEVCEREP